MWTGEHKGREEEEGEEKETAAVDGVKIAELLGDLFCCCSVFLFPSSLLHLLQVQKRKES